MTGDAAPAEEEASRAARHPPLPHPQVEDAFAVYLLQPIEWLGRARLVPPQVGPCSRTSHRVPVHALDMQGNICL